MTAPQNTSAPGTGGPGALAPTSPATPPRVVAGQCPCGQRLDMPGWAVCWNCDRKRILATQQPADGRPYSPQRDAYLEMRGDGATPAVAAAILGLGPRTADGYEAAWRRAIS